MSQHATELCLLLVDDIYGELTARVFRVLMTYGRLRLHDIQRRSDFTPRQIKHSLAVLVQQHLALWYTDPDSSVTYYEANWVSAYALVRWGRYTKAVEDRFAPFVGSLFTNFLISGHLRVKDLEKAYDLSRNEKDLEPTTNGSLINGINGEAKGATDNQPSLSRLHLAIHGLLKAKFLAIVHKSNFRSEADNRIEAERFLRGPQNVTGMLKGKEKLSFANEVDNLLLRWKHGAESTIEAIKEGKLDSIKRPREEYSDDEEPQSKRPRYTNGISARGLTSSSKNDLEGRLDENLVLRINEGKVAVTARTEMLVKLVEKRIGSGTSLVYSVVLRKLEEYIEDCQDEKSQVELENESSYSTNSKIRTQEIVKIIADWDSLKDTIADVQKIGLKGKMRHGYSRGRHSSVDEPEVKAEEAENEDEEAEESDESTSAPESRDEKTELVRQHLRLLAGHPYHFLSRYPERAGEPESWSVPYTALSKHLRLIELEGVIQSRYKGHALRIVRILQDKGKLDEKTIANFGLINPKLMRSTLTAMHAGGHLELQEVPRDTNRQPSRTIFLWFFDSERCRSKVLEDTYKTMARCMQRINAERDSVRDVLDKASRSDVKGKEEELLVKDELVALESWRKKEERLLGQIARLDDLVLVLDDF